MSNDATLDTFFEVLNDTTFANYHDVGYLLKNVFCSDNSAGNPQYPWAGIAHHGPQFVGAKNIGILFNELFTSFLDFTSTPLPGAPRLYSHDGATIGIQTTLTGTQVAPWFGKHEPFQSPPLSNIIPDKYHVMQVPACSVCVFDEDHLITHLSIYTDRYRMMRQLTPPSPSIDANLLVSLFVERAFRQL
jgi:hypothetical protein